MIRVQNAQVRRIRPLKINSDPDPAQCKVLYELIVTRNFCSKMAYKTYRYR
jgi:hypothetical protein